MFDQVPVWLQVSSVFVASAGGMFGFYKAGYINSRGKNGYVKKNDCHTNIDKITTSISVLHEKINLTNTGVAKIQGYLERMEKEN